MKKTDTVLFRTANCNRYRWLRKKLDTIWNSEGIQSNTLKTQSAPVFTYYNFGADITEDDLLKNPDDAAYEKFNYVDYALTLGMLEIYKHHGGLLNSLISSMQSTPNKCYNLFTFASEHPELNPIYDSVFASRFSNFSTYGNWKSFVQANYKYDTTYIPFVRFANLGTINFDLPAYAAGPFEINEEKFADFDDDLPMWINNNEEILFTTVNETTAFLVQNPILLTTNSFVGFEEVTNPAMPDYPNPPTITPMSCNIPNPPAPHTHEMISHTQFKINERYEGTGKSEYNFAYVSGKTYIQSNNNWGNWAGSLKQKEMKVHKDQIGQMLNFDFDVFYPDYYPTPFCIDINMLTLSHLYDHNFAVAAYERDWYAGYKDLFKITYAGTEETIQARMKFDNEWYFWDPSTNNSYDFMNRNPNPNSEYVSYTKGEVHLLRHY